MVSNTRTMMSPYSNIRSHARESTKLRQNVAELDRRIRDLHTQLDVARTESQTKDHQFDRDIMLCAQTEARRVFEAMQAALPQELCDVIWSYLVPRSTIQGVNDVFFENFPSQQGRSCYNHFDYCLPPPPPVPPPPYPLFLPCVDAHATEYVEPDLRIFSPDFINKQVALEAAKSFYQNNTFMLTTQCEIRSLSRLLTNDRFNLGLQPFEFIQKLHIRLSAEACSWHRQWHPQSDQGERLRIRQYRTELEMNMTRFPVEHCSKVELTITIMISACEPHQSMLAQEGSLLNMLSAIRKAVYSLKELGGKVATHVKLPARPAVDISSLFYLSVEEWQEERAQSVAPCEPALIEFAATESPALELEVAQARKAWGYGSFEALCRQSAEDSNV